MKKILLTGLSLGMFSIGIMAGNAMALPGASLQGVLDGITKAPIAGNSSVDVATEYVAPALDDYWAVSASGGSVGTIIAELAGYASENILGVYDHADPTKMVNLFAGTAGAGDQAMMSIKADGSVYVNFTDSGINFAGNNFGYFLKTPDTTFYSDTLLNGDAFDHMFAYQGTGTDTIQLPELSPGLWTPGEFVFAWEDLANGGDADYDDFIVMVESVNPVPEPASILLFGAGLAGLAGIVTKRRKNEEMFLP